MRIPSALEHRVRDQMIIVLDELGVTRWSFSYIPEETWLFVGKVPGTTEQYEKCMNRHLKNLPVIWSRIVDSKGESMIKILEKPREGDKFFTHITERSDI